MIRLLILAWLLAPGDGWIALFNGKDLKGWSGDPRLWKVENGVIVASTDQQSTEQNTFLIYEKPFADFHLKAEVRLRNGNSGIHFRSQAHDGPGWIVSGYQADFSEDGDRSAWGNFYEERGRGRNVMKTTDEGWRKGKALVRHQDWNTVEVMAEGNRIRVFLNGTMTIDTTDDQARDGVIAIQLHRGVPMQVEVRSLMVKPLGGSR